MSISRRKTVSGASGPTGMSGPKGPMGPAPTAKSSARKAPGHDQMATGAAPVEASVGVSLSEAGRLVSSAKAALSAIPDVRVGRVSEIRLSVDEGSYTVESQTVAKRMVDESLRESAHRSRKRNG